MGLNPELTFLLPWTTAALEWVSPCLSPGRLRLVLTWQFYLTEGERELVDHQHPVHGRTHNSGPLFGHAADRCTDPDWHVLPDGHLPDACKLIHAARKGDDRFCVGRGARYTFQQANDTAKAEDCSFESLHKIYFYDGDGDRAESADSILRLLPRPGLPQTAIAFAQQ